MEKGGALGPVSEENRRSGRPGPKPRLTDPYGVLTKNRSLTEKKTVRFGSNIKNGGSKLECRVTYIYI